MRWTVNNRRAVDSWTTENRRAVRNLRADSNLVRHRIPPLGAQWGSKGHVGWLNIYRYVRNGSKTWYIKCAKSVSVAKALSFGWAVHNVLLNHLVCIYYFREVQFEKLIPICSIFFMIGEASSKELGCLVRQSDLPLDKLMYWTCPERPQ